MERRLEELLSGAQPFAFALTRVATLSDAAVLVPEPAEPFAAAHAPAVGRVAGVPAVRRRVRRHRAARHRGASTLSAADRAAIEAALAPRLPLAARATEVLLVEETASGPLRVRRRFALGA